MHTNSKAYALNILFMQAVCSVLAAGKISPKTFFACRILCSKLISQVDFARLCNKSISAFSFKKVGSRITVTFKNVREVNIMNQ